MFPALALWESFVAALFVHRPKALKRVFPEEAHGGDHRLSFLHPIRSGSRACLHLRRGNREVLRFLDVTAWHGECERMWKTFNFFSWGIKHTQHKIHLLQLLYSSAALSAFK